MVCCLLFASLFCKVEASPPETFGNSKQSLALTSFQVLKPTWRVQITPFLPEKTKLKNVCFCKVMFASKVMYMTEEAKHP
jgi:hypothetical protein